MADNIPNGIDVEVTLGWSESEHPVEIPPHAPCGLLAGRLAEFLELPDTAGADWEGHPIYYVLVAEDGRELDARLPLNEAGIHAGSTVQLGAVLGGWVHPLRLSPDQLNQAISSGTGSYVHRQFKPRHPPQIVTQMHARRWGSLASRVSWRR